MIYLPPLIITHNSIDIKNPYYNKEKMSTLRENEGKPAKVTGNSDNYIDYIPKLNSDMAYHGEHSINKKFCEYIPKQLKSLNKNEYRLMSYNVHNFVKRCNTSLPLERSNNNLIDILQQTSPDILFCQEITPDITAVGNKDESVLISDHRIGNFEAITQKLKRLNYKYQFIADTKHILQKYNTSKPNQIKSYYLLCNGTFSKYPIINQASFALGGNNRICIYTLIKLPNEIYLACFNVHIEFDIDKKYKNKSFIEIQINNLILIINNIVLTLQKNNDRTYYILTGDFNNDLINNPLNLKCIDSLKQYMNMLNPIFHGFHYNTSKPPNTIFSAASNLNIVIDYFFINSPTGIELTNNNYYILPYTNSDHYPIVYDLNIQNNFQSKSFIKPLSSLEPSIEPKFDDDYLSDQLLRFESSPIQPLINPPIKKKNIFNLKNEFIIDNYEKYQKKLIIPDLMTEFIKDNDT